MLLSSSIPVVGYLRRGSAVARLLGLLVRIPLERGSRSLLSVSVLSVSGLCEWLLTCPEESYRLWCVSAGRPRTTTAVEN
jgi:hypothetical protein